MKNRQKSDLKRLLRGQLQKGIKAAVAGSTIERMAVGVTIEHNLAFLQKVCNPKK